MTSSRWLVAFGALAALSAILHGASHVLDGTAPELLWICNLAPVLLAIGCFARVPALVAVAVLWLAYGTPMWLLDLATGGALIPTSLLPHVLCPIIGVLAMRELGAPRHAWLHATGGLVIVLIATRVLTPPGPNVNLVHAVWTGWEPYFPRHDVYLGIGLATTSATFLGVELLLRRLVRVRAATSWRRG